MSRFHAEQFFFGLSEHSLRETRASPLDMIYRYTDISRLIIVTNYILLKSFSGQICRSWPVYLRFSYFSASDVLFPYLGKKKGPLWGH